MRAKEFVTEYKKYPTTEYGGVTFTMVEKDGQLIVKALNDFGIAMGHVVFNMDGQELDPKDLEVEEKYQGQGIASTMYDYIKSRGFTINRSFDQTDAGRGFWDKHRGEDSYVWEGVDADQVLQYVKQAHAPNDFDIEHSITDHPHWELKNIPVSQLNLDPEGEHQDPYGRVNWVDWDKVQDLLPNIGAVLNRMPIVVDSQGWIIDGNHRATAAAEAGLKSMPAYVPTALNEDTSNSQWLYHATYRPLLKSIKVHGLGGDRAQAKWEDSKPGVVYLARDPDVAESYAESSDVVPDDWLDQIVVFKIRADQLDPSRLFADQNVQDNSGDTLEYRGVIPVASLSLIENFADGKVKGKSRPGRVKRAGASCAGSVTDLRAKARKYGGERGRMYHWCANMKGGKKK